MKCRIRTGYLCGGGRFGGIFNSAPEISSEHIFHENQQT